MLAAGAVAHLGVGRADRGHGTPALARTVVVSGVAANVVNNLPALLVALPTLDHHAGPTLWAVLAGVNMGPVLLVTGSLASLLWLDALGRLGVHRHRPRLQPDRPAGRAAGRPRRLGRLLLLCRRQLRPPSPAAGPAGPPAGTRAVRA